MICSRNMICMPAGWESVPARRAGMRFCSLNPDLYYFKGSERRLTDMNIRYTTFLCPSHIQRSKREIRQTALTKFKMRL